MKAEYLQSVPLFTRLSPAMGFRCAGRETDEPRLRWYSRKRLPTKPSLVIAVCSDIDPCCIYAPKDACYRRPRQEDRGHHKGCIWLSKATWVNFTAKCCKRSGRPKGGSWRREETPTGLKPLVKVVPQMVRKTTTKRLEP